MQPTWVGQNPGKDSPLRISYSPFLFGQRGIKNILYLPKLRDLPQSGVDFKTFVYDFGFSANPGMSALDTQNISLNVVRNVLIWGICGISNDATGQGAQNQQFVYQVFHTHQGTQYQFFQKHVWRGVAAGVGALPFILRYPHMALAGDALEVEIKNLGTPVAPAVTSIQLVLFGGEFS